MMTPKSWGFEDEVVNLEYCGKRMLCREGHRCSVHHHKKKDEVLMVSNDSGLLWFESGSSHDKMSGAFLQSLDRIRVRPDTWHRFTALRDTYICEFSTHHDDSDSYRHKAGGRIDDDEFRQLLRNYFLHENGDRIIDVGTAGIIAQALRNEGRSVGLCNGCFDLMHLGHASLLAQARDKCEILFVAVNGDEPVAKLKGPARPFVDARGRMGMVASNRFVDYVVACQGTDCLDVVDAVRPHVYVTTTEHGRTGPEASQVARQGGQVEVVLMIDGYNTSQIAKRITNAPMEATHARTGGHSGGL